MIARVPRGTPCAGRYPAAVTRLSPLATLLLPLLSVSFAAPPAAAFEATPIPGTRISLVIPEDFVLSEGYPGIVNEKAFTSVMVSEVPTPLPVMRMSLTEEKLRAGGMELLGTETLSAAGSEAVLVHARQMAGGNPFEKWILVFGNRSSTVSLVATTPAVMADRFAAPLRRSLLSVRWTPGVGKYRLRTRLRVSKQIDIVAAAHFESEVRLRPPIDSVGCLFSIKFDGDFITLEIPFAGVEQFSAIDTG